MNELTVLHLEDDLLDAELIAASLEEGGFRCVITRVDTREDFVTALASQKFDLILADYSLPSFDGISALETLRARQQDIPFILISGALGEDLAIESLKRGATDYVLKHRLERLSPAVDRALREERAKDERRRVEQALAFSEERLRLAVDGADIGTWHWNIVGNSLAFSDRAMHMLGLSPDTPMSYPLFFECLHPDDRARIEQAVQYAIDQQTEYHMEYRTRWPDGSIHWVMAKGRAYYDAREIAVRMEGILQNIDARKQNEQELALAYEREALINQIGQAIHGLIDLDAIKNTASTALGQALNADYCFYITYTSGHDSADVSFDWRRNDFASIAGRYLITDAIVTPDIGERLGQVQVVADAGQLSSDQKVRSLLRVPLASDRSPISLVVAMATVPRFWTQHEIMLVETVAAQIYAALEAARAQHREHQIATILQDALQPPIPEYVPGLSVTSFMKAALDEASIGGDFFDVFALDKQHYAFIIGDVSGKGLAAAAQVSITRNMLRSVLYQHYTPSQAAATLNTILTAHELLTGFVTLFVSIYDAGAHTLTYASCGHEPSLVYRAATETVEELQTTGTPLGVAENARYTEITIDLHPNDGLLMYTDGLSESGPNRREMLGTDGLGRLFGSLASEIDVQRLASRLISDVSHISNGVFRDDVCILLVRVVSNPISDA